MVEESVKSTKNAAHAIATVAVCNSELTILVSY